MVIIASVLPLPLPSRTFTSSAFLASKVTFFGRSPGAMAVRAKLRSKDQILDKAHVSRDVDEHECSDHADCRALLDSDSVAGILPLCIPTPECSPTLSLSEFC